MRERDWEQFHTPKNLTMALAAEAGELLEIFQWLKDKEAAAIMNDIRKAEEVSDELADILYYLVRLADVLGVDLAAAMNAKMAKNAKRYPVALAKGNARKYTEFNQ